MILTQVAADNLGRVQQTKRFRRHGKGDGKAWEKTGPPLGFDQHRVQSLVLRRLRGPDHPGPSGHKKRPARSLYAVLTPAERSKISNVEPAPNSTGHLEGLVVMRLSNFTPMIEDGSIGYRHR